MIWLDIIRRFWPWLAGAALILGSDWYFHHQGYVSGHAASEAHWKQLFAEAERARDAANAEARRKEADSTRLNQLTEAEYAATLQTLHETSAAADQRIRALSMRLAAASARRCDVPALSGPATVIDGPSSSPSRADGAGASLAGLARRCEADSITLATLQRWLTEQRAIFNRP